MIFQKKEKKQQLTQKLHDRGVEQKSSAAENQTDSDSSHSSNGCRKVSREDIELVQNLIERCLQLYKTRDEIVSILCNRANIDPGLTTLVWQKLEEENAEFFKAYYVRLKLKKQIFIFNQLLERQCHLMNREPLNAISPFVQNGFQRTPMNSSVGYLASQLPCIPSNGPTYIGPLNYHGSHYVVDGVPATGSFYPTQLNTVSSRGSVGGIEQEVASSRPSNEFSDRFSFAPVDIQIKADPVTFDAAFSPNICSREEFQQASYDGNGNSLFNSYSHISADLDNYEDLVDVGENPNSPISLADIDTLLNCPDECDIVDLIGDA